MALGLLQRLINHLVANGMKWDKAREEAIRILRERGQMEQTSTNLTPKGLARQALGVKGRAKERSAVAAGRDPDDYTYSPKTGRATLKGNK